VIKLQKKMLPYLPVNSSKKYIAFAVVLLIDKKYQIL
jgi:hypothetical protein